MFFIVGSARSGTTLLRIMLNAHPDVAVPPESRFITELWRGEDEVDVDRFLAELRDHSRFKLWDLPIEEVQNEITGSTATYADAIEAAYRAYAKHRGKSMYGDKTPRYVEQMPLLAKLWPKARFIHQIRDGRNVALSYADVPFGPKDVAGAARLWKARVRAGRDAGHDLPGRYVEIRYEDFIEDLESSAKLICDFLSIEFDEGMLDYTERARDDILPRAAKYNPNISKPVDAAPKRSWRDSMINSQVRLFEAIAGDLLEDLAYERKFSNPGPRARFLAALSRLKVPVGRFHKSEA
jgi:Sulfotransferase family